MIITNDKQCFVDILLLAIILLKAFEIHIGADDFVNQIGNTNTLAGNVPPKANLGDLRGLAGGLNGLNTSAMIDGGSFDGAKAYKDSKVCNMLTMQEFHRRYHEETGITFASLYPGCIATTGLFREHIPLFRLLFPPFQKFITKGFVSEDESGKRLAQVVEITNKRLWRWLYTFLVGMSV